LTRGKPHNEYGFFRFFVGQSVFVNLMTLFVLTVGGYIAFTMVKEAFPNIDFDIMTVSTSFPGSIWITPGTVKRQGESPGYDSGGFPITTLN